LKRTKNGELTPVTNNAYQTIKDAFDDNFVTRLCVSEKFLVSSPNTLNQLICPGQNIIPIKYYMECFQSYQTSLSSLPNSLTITISNDTLILQGTINQDVNFDLTINGSCDTTVLNISLNVISNFTYNLTSSSSSLCTGDSKSSNFSNIVGNNVLSYQSSNASNNRDLFLLKINTNNFSITGFTFLGGNSDETNYYFDNLKVANNKVYITGYTSSLNFPITNSNNLFSNIIQNNNAGSNDVFLSIFDLSLQSLLYSTFIGGSNDDFGRALDLWNNCQIYITGNSVSNNYPV